MNCKHFGKCGACNFYNLSYEKALDYKKNYLIDLMKQFYSSNIDIFPSITKSHRARAEFRIWHKADKAYYAMTNLEKNGVELIDECPKLIEVIKNTQFELLNKINKIKILKDRLFSIEFLGSKSGELLVTLIYHKRLDEKWKNKAIELEKIFNISIIGRSRKQKEILSKDYIIEKLRIQNIDYFYKYYEGGFTQPNPYINEKMISWVINNIQNSKDLLELYCGLGNFTIPLSKFFRKVLATEISKNSIKAAKENCILNNIGNIEFIRMDASDTAKALKGIREFKRLKDLEINKYDFSHVLVDPPRAGLDKDSLDLIKNFDNIIYISCNPITLKRDLELLINSHKIKNIALFDQFPYTKHIESGVYLERV